MILNLIKIILFVFFLNWIIGMHMVNARVNSKSQKITTVLIALLFSVFAGIVLVL
jgi:hypothetical protein